MKIAAAVFTGSKCDKDSIEGAEQISDKQVVRLWHTGSQGVFESIRTIHG